LNLRDAFIESAVGRDVGDMDMENARNGPEKRYTDVEAWREK
jgi:hypothetical protein